MLRIRARMVWLPLLIASCAIPPLARAAEPVSVLGDLQPGKGLEVHKTADGLKIVGKSSAEANIVTKQIFKTPLIITAVAKVPGNNLRICFGQRGVLIFNWEGNPTQLRYNFPQKNSTYYWADGQGSVPHNQWVTIRLILEPNRTRIEVNGKERASFSSDNTGLSGAVGFQTYKDSVMFVHSLTVSSLNAPASEEAPTELPKEEAPPPIIEVAVPTTPPAAGGAQAASTTSQADPDAIGRPQYLNQAMDYTRSLSSITSLMVVMSVDGEPIGMASQIIATVPPSSLSGTKAGAGFVRPDGDEDMKTTFEEAVRAVTMRYPYWHPGHMDFSFSEKSVRHEGPSAGAAFATLMLSLLEGFPIDPRCGVTGDITVDWRVREVGGVAAKLHGATLDKCLYAVIPAGNVPAVNDMPLLLGDHALWDIQIFSAARLQDVVAVARTDRAPALQKAMGLFTELQHKLDEKPSVLYDAATRDTLNAILKLAPNDVSAQCLLDISNHTAPRTLSLNGTLHQIAAILHSYGLVLQLGQPLDRTNLPAEVTAEARRRLAVLRPIANKDATSVLAAVSAYVNVIEAFATHRAQGSQLLAAFQRVRAAYAKLDSDPKVIDRMWREGY
jgi:hypothetical protein